MKKLLYQLDTDQQPSVFDNVVAYDGGADHVTALGGTTPDNVAAAVDGAIFTRSPRDKKNTALFVGGSDMAAGEAVLAAIRKRFFADFRVSVMLDSNGANTTAAAAVAWLAHGRSLAGMRAVVLAGTGPVGSRAAALLARDGAEVTITSRTRQNAERAAQAIGQRFGVQVRGVQAADTEARVEAIADAQIVMATGGAGAVLLPESAWKDHAGLQLLADANAMPPAGIEGIAPADRNQQRHGKQVFGALGFGALKLALQRACIARLFESNDQVLDAEQIHDIARQMVGK